MVGYFCSRKGELLGLCHQIYIKPRGTYRTFPLALNSYGMLCQLQEKAPMDRESSGRKAQSVRCSQYLQREILGFCIGGSKAHEKAQARRKITERSTTTQWKCINRLCSMSRRNRKDVISLKGIKGYLGWMLAISFIPGLPGCSSEGCLEMQEQCWDEQRLSMSSTQSWAVQGLCSHCFGSLPHLFSLRLGSKNV